MIQVGDEFIQTHECFVKSGHRIFRQSPSKTIYVVTYVTIKSIYVQAEDKFHSVSMPIGQFQACFKETPNPFKGD